MKWIDQTVEKNKFAELTNFLLKPTEIPNSILSTYLFIEYIKSF